MYTHIIKSSKQKCFMAPWWPSVCEKAIAREKTWPMVTTENGQTMRIRKANLRKVGENDK
jgi:hypothetical protein